MSSNSGQFSYCPLFSPQHLKTGILKKFRRTQLMNTFVSPDTGKTYEITTQSQWFNDYSNSGTIVKKWYTQYNILENNKLVRFVFDEKQIAEMIHFHEFGDGWTTSPRD